MALGSILGIQYSSNVSEGGDWSTISNLVGWWDFSDINTLFKSRDSYDTPVTANDDLIGRVKNKAGGANKLGEFLTQRDDAYRPKYKTGGTNSQSYAYNDGTAQIGFLGGNFTSWAEGGITATKFSDCIFLTGAITIITVCKQDVEDIASKQTLFQIDGIDTTGGTNGSAFLKFEKYSSDDPAINISYGTDEAGQFISGGSNVWDTDDRIVSLSSGPGTNGIKVYYDATVELQDTLANAADPIDMSLPIATGRSSISIGGQPNSYGNLSASNWNGRIYEVLVYDKLLSDAELLLVQTYLNTKYTLY